MIDFTDTSPENLERIRAYILPLARSVRLYQKIHGYRSRYHKPRKFVHAYSLTRSGEPARYADDRPNYIPRIFQKH